MPVYIGINADYQTYDEERGVTFPPQQIEPIGWDEPLGKNDVHTLFGAIWKHYGELTPNLLWMLRAELGWKIHPIEDEA
jgi:hypothetical protein